MFRFVFAIRTLLLAALLGVLTMPFMYQSSVSAIENHNKGLSISPLRKQISVKAGAVQYGSATVANLTDKTMVVSMSIKEFSVDTISYEYKFNEPSRNWVGTNLESVYLQPREKKSIDYEIQVPSSAKPGGYYYALFASTQPQDASFPSTIQVVSLIYMTVDGELDRSSVLKKESVPWLVMGSSVPYTFTVQNTGNVHFVAYFRGVVEGLWTKNIGPESVHIMMPGSPREVSGSVQMPVLPGAYKMTYGYKVDYDSSEVSKTAIIVFVPPWFLAGVLFVVLCIRWMRQRKHTHSDDSLSS